MACIHPRGIYIAVLNFTINLMHLKKATIKNLVGTQTSMRSFTYLLMTIFRCQAEKNVTIMPNTFNGKILVARSLPD